MMTFSLECVPDNVCNSSLERDKSVRAFYIRAMEYPLANLPLNDGVLKNATFVHVPFKEDTSFAEVEYFVPLGVSFLKLAK